MAADTQVLTFAECAAADVRGVLEPVDTKGRYAGLRSLDAILADSRCFRMMHEGRVVGAYALQLRGDVLWVTAAAGRADFDLSAVLAVLVEQQGQEFNEIAFKTRRRGLVKKALARGYEIDSYVLRKKIK